ncbi:DUF535 domain-containing protein [Duganella sp. FT94W]|uniref:DUF535 domain-containing protein n=1 Tax=Duganella lactea TaxID=2692173 RepID=A0ABW9VDS0_9BURK|nr:VirK/YbjX family protein [Duganella lactea]MYM35762.1 DUF535 domain-containing protein [Duganella lactea]
MDADWPTITVRSGAKDFIGLPKLRETIKLCMRAWLHRHATRDWLAVLNSQAWIRALVVARPRLVCKIYRPYLSNAFSPARRVTLLAGHYRFVQQLGLEKLILHAAYKPVDLASVTGKTGDAYRVVLRAIEPMEREGELVLQLRKEDTLVYSCAFTFFVEQQRMVLGIGCMQGPQCGVGLQLIREATRELHGLRPKNLMIRLLEALGAQLNCAALRLVGNNNRVVHRARQQGKVHADYDTFWQECGATPRTDGDFELICAPLSAPDFQALPSNKRSAARKRHEAVCNVTDMMIMKLLPDQTVAWQGPDKRRDKTRA